MLRKLIILCILIDSKKMIENKNENVSVHSKKKMKKIKVALFPLFKMMQMVPDGNFNASPNK